MSENEQKLQFEVYSKSVQDFVNLYENGQLILNPGFQRKSVWSLGQRRLLIGSILDGYPMPSIFLYCRNHQGKPVYDVIDGKQRLETILGFLGKRKMPDPRFAIKHQFPDDDRLYHYDSRDLEKWDKIFDVHSYRLQVVEVSGDLANIVDLFVRINSTGKALVGAERKHAQYFTHPFLKGALKIANRQRRFLTSAGVIRAGQIDRMKDVELISELLASAVNDCVPVAKKDAVDGIVGNAAVDGRKLARAQAEVVAALKLTKTMFPVLPMTRFKRMPEFYSLVLMLMRMRREGLVLKGRERQRQANALLTRFSTQVDEVAERQRGRETLGSQNELYTRYLLTVQQGTGGQRQRQRRTEILDSVFGGLFENKDAKRLFSPEQRRILWNQTAEPQCRGCGLDITWGDFEVDHIKPHSRGGKTALKNAQLLCRSCNRKKGARVERSRVG